MLLEVLHQAALVPLLAVLLLRPPEPEYLLIGAGLGVSWVGDSLAHYAGGSFVPSYFWLPVQIALVLAAFPPGGTSRLASGLWTGVGCSVLAVASASLTAPGPDRLVTIAGSVAILAVARDELRLPLYLYFGFGTVCYLLMVERIRGDVIPAWSLYQTARVLAFVAFIWLVWSRRGRWANG